MYCTLVFDCEFCWVRTIVKSGLGLVVQINDVGAHTVLVVKGDHMQLAERLPRAHDQQTWLKNKH